MDELGAERAEMAEFHWARSEEIVFLFILGVFGGKAIHKSRWLLKPIEIRIDDSRFMSLIRPIECFQHISTNELIICIQS